MGTAYTPGLTVSADAVVRKLRRLPLAGDILVEVGDRVEATTPVARALLPGDLVNVRVADELGIEPSEINDVLKVSTGAEVSEGDVIAEMKGLFGLFTSRARAPTAGTVEYASAATGHVGIRRAPTPVEVTAFVQGRIAETNPPDSVLVETRGARVQGVFGVGGETAGVVACVSAGPDAALRAADLPGDLAGRIVIGGGWAEPDAWRLLAERKAVGLIIGSLRDSELKDFLGYDLGLAITGHEDVPYTVIVTEGFGHVPMSKVTFDLLASLEGRPASMSGQTQIRAGAVRPELVAPREEAAGPPEALAAGAPEAGELAIGSAVRLIRHPHFGLVGRVVELPEEPTGIPTGAKVRVLAAELGDGRTLVVPRSNVELFVG
jgi:hypothetical protein